MLNDRKKYLLLSSVLFLLFAFIGTNLITYLRKLLTEVLMYEDMIRQLHVILQNNCCQDVLSQLLHEFHDSFKGHLISKGFFDVLNSSKKRKNLT